MADEPKFKVVGEEVDDEALSVPKPDTFSLNKFKSKRAAAIKSDRQIAETVKASPTTVGTVRAEMEAKGDVSKLDTRRDSKGREQPAARTSGRKKKTTTKREMKELKEATGKQKQKVTHDIVCLIAELINAHATKGMEMFVRQCLAEYAKEVVRARPEA